MENKEQLNSEHEKNKSEAGEENLTSEKTNNTIDKENTSEPASQNEKEKKEEHEPQIIPTEHLDEQQQEIQEDESSDESPVNEEKEQPSESTDPESQPKPMEEETLPQADKITVKDINKDSNINENPVSEPTTDEIEKSDLKTGKTVESERKDESDTVKTRAKSKTDAEESYSDEEIDLTEKYNALSKEQLVETIQALVLHEDINFIRKHIGYIKVAFRNHLKAESVNNYEKNIQEDKGIQEDTSQEVSDPLLAQFEQAFAVYKQKKIIFDQALEKQKQDNLVAKEKILEELRNLIDSEEELKKTYDVFKELQEQWRDTGPVPQASKSTLWNNYHFLVEKFFDKVKINKELRDLDLKKNLESKTELCEKAEELLLETSVNKSFQQLQKLHEAWKEIGPTPKDKKDVIWERFKAATDTLNERRQAYYEGLREEQNRNYAAKVVLCEKAEQLIDFHSNSPREWQKSTEQINELFNVWKSLGFAPKKLNNEVWNRFRTALDTFFKNKKAFFQKYKDEQSENYNQKLSLCVQAEALKESEDWKQTTDQLIALQKQWKKIGPVPNKFSDKIWKRFRAACDTFFNRKSEFFSNIGEKQDENLRLKKELIENVKNHPYSDDNNENLTILKEFQRRWMDIGHVPIKHKDLVQSEFRKAVNDQFEKLNISRKAKTAIGFKNKIESIKTSPNADNIIYKERSFLINKINGLQNDIKLWENNIGFFASSKKADVLKSEFEQKIENAKNEITILEEKLKIIRES